MSAQRRARMSSVRHRVRFNVVEVSYGLERFSVDDWEPLPHSDHPSLPYVVALADEPYNASIASVDFGADTFVVFDGYGVPDSSGFVVIQSGAYTKTIVLNQDSGRVEIQ